MKNKTVKYTKSELDDLRKDVTKTKICNICNEEKPISSFRATNNIGKKENSIRYYYICKTCNKCHYRIKINKNPNIYDNAITNYKLRIIGSLEGRAKRMYTSCKSGAIKRNREITITEEDILEKLRGGICEITGIPLDFSSASKLPYSPSIDRVDSSKGYTIDNIKLVCLIYNYCKNEFTKEEVDDFFNKIREKIIPQTLINPTNEGSI